MFALVDCNNFYASCERVFRPDLRTKPVVILSNNDGCVIARSNETKALGIAMGVPYFEIKELIQKHDIQVFSSNFALYGDFSNRVMGIMESINPNIEVYSVDEAFLHLHKLQSIDFVEYGKNLRYKVTKGTGIPISVGIASSKTLSKVANRIAKKYPDKTENVYVIDTEEKRIKALKWLKIEDVWGIGRQYAKKMMAQNIITAYDFTLQTDDWVRKEMGVIGLRMKKELLGENVLDLDEVKPKQSIATTRTFDKPLKTFDELRERIVTYASSCARKLRKQKSHCNSLSVFVRTNSFKKDSLQYRNQILINLPFASNSDFEVVHFALVALKKIYKSGFDYKKAGVIVMHTTPENQPQLSLFQNTDPKHANLMLAMDKLNKKIGVNKVHLAAQGLGKQWKMKQDSLSPRYTTRIEELLKIKL